MHFVSQRWLIRVLMLACWTVGVPPESFAQAPPAAPAAARDMDYLKAEGGLASLPSPVWVQKRPIPLDVHFAVTKDLSRTDAPYNKGHIRTRETAAGAPGVAFKVADAIVTGTKGETWPIASATFEATYSPVAGGRMWHDGKFFKKPVPVLGVQMKEPFAVTASWGRLQGKSGEWLVQYNEAGKDFGIVGEALFQETYERLQVTPKLRARLDTMRARVPRK
jgi:PGDYG protein